MIVDPVQSLYIWMVLIIMHFMVYINEQHEATGHPNRHTRQIDKGEAFLFPEVPKGDFEIIL